MSKAVEFLSSVNPVQQKPDHQPEVQERIQKRAYELYEARGATPGHELEDWTQAEAELLREPGIHRAA